MGGKAEATGEVLNRQYRLSCELFDTFPQPYITQQLSRACLELHLFPPDLDHLEALCHSIKNKVSPTHLRITVPVDKKVAAKVVDRAVEGAAVCLVASLTLTSLALHNVRLRGRTLKLLCEGLRKTRTLKILHLEKCDLGDSGTESVCQAVKNVPSVTHLSLVDCGVAEKGATAIASLIKHQRLNRDSAMWQDTLRQRRPFLDGMRGLRRLTLNSNPALGDEGAAAIAEVLIEDLWIKAIDLQHCGLGAAAGASLCAVLRANQTLELVDMHNNPFLPDHLLAQVMSLLHGRQTHNSPQQYSWLGTSQLEEEGEGKSKKDQQEEGRGGGGNTVSYRGSGRGRCVVGKRTVPQPSHISTHRPKVPSQLGVPWRVEHRLYERKEGLTPGSMVKEYIGEQQQQLQDQSVVEAASQHQKETTSEGDASRLKMRQKLQHYRKKYRKERDHRQKLERKLSRIQAQLKGLHTLDEATITHIEECFLKFHLFLNNMHHQPGEHLHHSSPSGAGSPLPQPDTITHPPSGSSLPLLPLPTLFPDPPLPVPVPVLLQQPQHKTKITTSFSSSSSSSSKHRPLPSHPFDSVEGNHHNPKKESIEPAEASGQSKDGVSSVNPSMTEIALLAHNQSSTVQSVTKGTSVNQAFKNNGDTAEKERNSCYNETVGSHHFANNGSPVSELNYNVVQCECREEEIIRQNQRSIRKRLHKFKKGKHLREGMWSNEETVHVASIQPVLSKPVEQKHSVGTQVTSDILNHWNFAQGENGAHHAGESSLPIMNSSLAMKADYEEINRRLKPGRIKYTHEYGANDLESSSHPDRNALAMRADFGDMNMRPRTDASKYTCENGANDLEISNCPDMNTLAMRTELEDLKGPRNGRTNYANENEGRCLKANEKYEANLESGDYSPKNKIVSMGEIQAQNNHKHLGNGSQEDINKHRGEGNLCTERKSEVEAAQRLQYPQSYKDKQVLQSSQSIKGSQLQLRQPLQAHQDSHQLLEAQKGRQSPHTSQQSFSGTGESPLYEMKSAEESQLPPLRTSSPRQLLHLIQSDWQDMSLSKQSPSNRQSPPSHSPNQSPHSLTHSPSLSPCIQSPRSQSSQIMSPSQSAHKRSPPSHSHQLHSPPIQSPHNPHPSTPSPHIQYHQFHHHSTPQESHSPKTHQSLQRQSFPDSKQGPKSPLAMHPSQEPIYPYSTPNQERSPRKVRLPKNEEKQEEEEEEVDEDEEELGAEVLQGSEVSETDDEKMRNLSAWLHGRMRERPSASTHSSSSSVSISEHLQHSHSSWTKGKAQYRHHHKAKIEDNERKEPQRGRGRSGEIEEKEETEEEKEDMLGESAFDFNVSDLEDLSISGITLTNTSVPEDTLPSPREEDF